VVLLVPGNEGEVGEEGSEGESQDEAVKMSSSQSVHTPSLLASQATLFESNHLVVAHSVCFLTAFVL
jgi:hypothetical protein